MRASVLLSRLRLVIDPSVILDGLIAPAGQPVNRKHNRRDNLEAYSPFAAIPSHHPPLRPRHCIMSRTTIPPPPPAAAALSFTPLF